MAFFFLQDLMAILQFTQKMNSHAKWHSHPQTSITQKRMIIIKLHHLLFLRYGLRTVGVIWVLPVGSCQLGPVVWVPGQLGPGSVGSRVSWVLPVGSQAKKGQLGPKIFK